MEQAGAQIVAFRRGEHGFLRQVHAGHEATIALPEVGCEWPLAEVYDGVELAAAP